MPTKNRRVAAYLPPEIDERFKTFVDERNFGGDSPALIAILSEYFGVSQQVAHQVDYSRFVTIEQFTSLLDKVQALESQLERLERLETRESVLSTGELAKRLGIDSSTLSHWKSTGKKGKSPDELLKATREKDPDGIGWSLIPGTSQFKPESDLPSGSDSVLQGSLLSATP
jgi:DNA-binding transcriptional regulator YiaG